MLGRSILSLATAVLAFTTSTTAVMTDWEKIHSVIHTFPMYIDVKDFDGLKHIFTHDATANYTGQLADLHGLEEITKALKNDTTGVATQHLLGTTVIDIKNHFVHPSSGQYKNISHSGHGCGRANSTTYVQVQRFASPYHHGEHVTLYGMYQDKFEKIGVSEWRICHRQWHFQGPGSLGNASWIGAIGRP